MTTFQLASIAVLSTALGGCYTSEFAPDSASKANAAFRDAEMDPKCHTANVDQRESVIRLWSDVPDYVFRLRREKEYKKAPRLVSSVPPSYPLIPLLTKIRATVSVSFVIDEKGTVEAARVLESSDSRFDRPALDAVSKWKFLPAEFDDGPAKAVVTVPIQFDGVR